MKGALFTVIAFLIIIAVLMIIPSGQRIDLGYILAMLEDLGSKPPPSLTGGYDFDTFVEGSFATLHIISYPLRLSTYMLNRIIVAFEWIGKGLVGVPI